MIDHWNKKDAFEADEAERESVLFPATEETPTAGPQPEDDSAEKDYPESDLPEAKRLTPGSDDPVRMYLVKAADWPLLTRPQEIALTRRVEETRRRFRRAVMLC